MKGFLQGSLLGVLAYGALLLIGLAAVILDQRKEKT
jgi:hypothetical protein